MAVVATVFEAADVVPEVEREASEVPVVGFRRTLVSKVIVRWAVVGERAVTLPPPVEPVPELLPDELPELEPLELPEELPLEDPLEEPLDEPLELPLEDPEISQEMPQTLRSVASDRAFPPPPPPAQAAKDRHAAIREIRETPRMIPTHTITVLLKMEMFG